VVGSAGGKIALSKYPHWYDWIYRKV